MQMQAGVLYVFVIKCPRRPSHWMYRLQSIASQYMDFAQYKSSTREKTTQLWSYKFNYTVSHTQCLGFCKRHLLILTQRILCHSLMV